MLAKTVQIKLFLILLLLLILGAIARLYYKDELKPAQKSEPNSGIVPDNLHKSDESNQPDSKNIPINIDSFYVAFNIANVHQKPNAESETVTQAIYGEPVRILTWGESWVKISLPDQFNYQGWIQRSALKSIPNFSIETHQKIVAVKNAEVRTLPNQDAPVLTVLPMGSVVTSGHSDVNDRFTSIQMVDERKGYIRSEDLLDYSPEKSSDVSSDRILDTARQLLSLPYLWGGMTTDGVDCSGFIHTVFKVNGIRLHRDADLQYLYDGVGVEFEELQPGDLVFFETYQSGASHVGIYVGNQTFIHSISQDGVSYASFDNLYFSDRFIGAKRILH